MSRDEFFDKPLYRNGGTYEDLIGKRFDKLLVIKLVGRRLYGNRKSGTALWECKCDCGNIKNITASALKNKKARSCSCSLREYRSLNVRKRYPDSNKLLMRRIYESYRNNAKDRRGYSFDIEENQFYDIINKNCFYCNSMPSNIAQNGYYSIKYSGLDRVDNSIGYIISNCVPCCIECDRAKRTMSQKDFFKLIINIYNNLKLGESNE